MGWGCGLGEGVKGVGGCGEMGSKVRGSEGRVSGVKGQGAGGGVREGGGVGWGTGLGVKGWGLGEGGRDLGGGGRWVRGSKVRGQGEK